MYKLAVTTTYRSAKVEPLFPSHVRFEVRGTRFACRLPRRGEVYAGTVVGCVYTVVAVRTQPHTRILTDRRRWRRARYAAEISAVGAAGGPALDGGTMLPWPTGTEGRLHGWADQHPRRPCAVGTAAFNVLTKRGTGQLAKLQVGRVSVATKGGPADSDSTTDGGREGVHKGSTLACCVWHLHRWHCMPGSRRRSLRTATAARLPSRAVWGAVCLEPAFAVVPTSAASSVRSAALAKPSTCIVDQLLSVTSHQHSDLERR